MERVIGFRVFVWLALLSIVLICGGEGRAQEDRLKPLVEGAKKEGKLQIYSLLVISDHLEIINRFKQKYPFVDVQLWRSTSEGILKRVLTESRAGQNFADVIGTSGFEINELVSRGLLQKYDSPESKYYEHGFKDADGYWTAFYINPLVTAYNTRMVPEKEAAKSYEDLLDPKWKGQLVMEEHCFEWFVQILRYWGEEKGLNYMRLLARQNFHIRRGHTAMTNLVAMGEYPGAFLLYAPQTESTKSKGAPIDWNPLSPTVAGLSSMGIAGRAPHPNAARLYLDHMLSEEIQRDYISGKFFKVSARLGVTSPVQQKLKKVKLIPSEMGKVENIERFSKLYKEIFTPR